MIYCDILTVRLLAVLLSCKNPYWIDRKKAFVTNDPFSPPWRILVLLRRLRKITGLGCSKDRPEPGGPPVSVHGVFGGQGTCAAEPLHEWTLLTALLHEEPRAAARLHSRGTGRYQRIHSTAVPKYSGGFCWRWLLLITNLRNVFQCRWVLITWLRKDIYLLQ